MKLLLPTDPLYLPAVNVRVFDHQFGGLHNPMIGYTAIDLESRVPLSLLDFETAASRAARNRPPKAEETKDKVTVDVWETQRRRFGVWGDSFEI